MVSFKQYLTADIFKICEWRLVGGVVCARVGFADHFLPG